MATSSVAAPPAYSTTYGQAIAPLATGDWQVASGGPGGTLNRKYYEQFTVTASAGTSLRLDSVFVTSAFYNTTGLLGVVYSSSGFVSDSAEISGGTLNGAALTFTTSNGFGKTMAVAKSVSNSVGPASPTNLYKLALNGSSGIMLAAGKTLSVRLYYACGSSSAGRYAMLRDVVARGQLLSAANSTTTTVDLTFSTLAGFAYGLSYTDGVTTTTVTPAPTASPYTLSGLAAGTTYTATLTGTRAGWASTTINVPFKTASATCPGVGSLAVGSITQTGASVSFTPGTGNTSFVVTYTPAGGSTTTVSPNPTASPVPLTGLTGGTTYTVTVQSNCGSNSGTAQSTTFTTLTCADPTGLAVGSITSTGASLSFAPGSGNSSYVVTYYPTGSPGAAQTVSPAPTASPVALTGLAAATAYTVTLQSTCANGAVGTVLTKTFTTRLTSSAVLEQFPLTANASDDATVRSPGVTGSTATLTGLTLSDGTSADGESGGALPAYSVKGQGVAPSGDGNGWTNASQVYNNRYEEFTLTAASGGSVRVDSLVFSAGGYGSGALVAVAYSTDGFANSTFISGTLAAPTALNKASNPGYSLLRLPLTGPAGVTVAAGNTLAFRLYYNVASSSQRHVLTRNLYVTGLATPSCPAVTNLAVGNVAPTSAQLSFIPGSGNTSYTVTLTPQGGSATTLTPAPTASPVTLTGLEASTTYTVTLQTNCGGTPGYVQSASFTTPAANSAVLQRWPLTADNADNAAVRSNAVAAATPTFAGLYSSTNTASSNPPVPAYSATYGQAFSPNANGDGGGWSGSLSSSVYEEFTLTAASGANLRADTLVFSTAFVNTNNGRLAVAYSTDGFATSTFLLGNLASYVTANNVSNTPFGTYRLALGSLTRASGQTLSVRFYFAAGSVSTGRYGLLRNVYFAGEGFVNNLPNLTIGDTRNVASGTTYGNVTVLSGGTATLTGPLAAQGAITVQNGGILGTNCQPLTGAATFALNAGAELRICNPAGITASAAAGAVQTTGQRTYSPDALYTYTGTTTGGANPATGDGLPATVRTLTVSLQAATDSLQLGSNLTVTSSLSLTQGILKTYAPTGSPSYVVTLNSGATTLSETSSSFVLGQVRSATLFFGADGSNSAFGGIGVRLVAHAATSLPGNTYVLRSTGQPVYGVGTSTSIRRQYRVVPTTDTGLNVDATFTFNPTAAELNGIPAANLQLFSRPIAGGSWSKETATITATTASATALTHLSDWTLGNAANPLPVQLVRFEATPQGPAVLLTWTTASELNNRGFEVQASADGREFRPLGFVAGAGNSASARSYQYPDATAQPGLRYYRLRQLDLDGTATYSATRTVRVAGAAGTFLQAAPNPGSGDALMLYTQATAATQATLRLTDALGRVVRTQPLAVPAGAGQLAVAGLAGLPAGLYVAELVLDGQPQRVKLVRE